MHQNSGIGIVETWRCRVSMFAIVYKILNINLLIRLIVRAYQNYHSNVAVEGVSKCDFAMSRDVALPRLYNARNNI